MIQNLTFGFLLFFENIISGIQIVCIRPQVPVDIIKVFLISQSLKLILQYSFAQKTSLILRV